MIFQSNNKTECDLITIPSSTPAGRNQIQVDVPKDPCITRTGRRKKNKKCREKEIPTEPFAKQIIGNYKQVELVNMEAYLKAEGGNWMYQRMAVSVMPNLEIKQYSDV